MNLITGNKFKNICDYVLDDGTLKKTNNQNQIPIYFIKTDYIDLFFNKFLPISKFKLITHNSDYSINNNHLNYLNYENLLFWYGQNVDVCHEKLKSIPIGIANEQWEHGNEDIIISNINSINKNDLIFCGFDINTNIIERTKCTNSVNKYGINNTKKLNFSDYISKLKSYYFSISPNGNGIDCHKIWESLYLKTIPIVTKSINISNYGDLPIHVIDSWDTFDLNNITISLYEKLMKKFDYNKLDINFYYNKIKN